MTTLPLDASIVLPPFAMKAAPGLSGVTDAAVDAMDAAPSYFAVWYTVKSVLLVGCVAYIAYKLGKDAGRKERSLHGA